MARQPSAHDVLAKLDEALTDGPYLLVAHNAPTEAGLTIAWDGVRGEALAGLFVAA